MNITTLSSVLCHRRSDDASHFSSLPWDKVWLCKQHLGWLSSPSLVWMDQSGSGRNSSPHVCLGPVSVQSSGWSAQISSVCSVLVWFAPKIKGLVSSVDCSSSSIDPLVSCFPGEDGFSNNFLRFFLSYINHFPRCS